jgi:hypothetical protein
MRTLTFLLIFVAVFSVTSLVHASVIATPSIVDLKGKTRDILKASIILENQSGNYVELYPFINNVTIEDGAQIFLDPASADSAVSLANWIELSRSSIILKAGEKKSVDFLVPINLRAKPGIYHAVITFSRGSTRDEAEGRMLGALQVPINVEVLDDIKERLQLKKFIPDRVFFSGFPITFSFAIENVGNREVTPSGEIRIYNRGGEEVGSIPVVADSGNAIEPGATASSTVVWNGPAGWGRHKALLDLEYGTLGQGTLNDTVFFWVVSWPLLLILFLALTSVGILGTLWLHRRASLRYDK